MQYLGIDHFLTQKSELTFNAGIQRGGDEVVDRPIVNPGGLVIPVPSALCLVADAEIAAGEATVTSASLTAGHAKEIISI